jgi:hypothetical protein
MKYKADFCIGGTPSASSIFSGSYPASNAFDGNAGTFWASATGIPQWIQYDLGAGVTKVAVQYTLTARSPSYNPASNLTFAGSNNGIDFTTIDTRTGLTWAAGEKKTFNGFVNSTPYRDYRITVTASSGGSAEFSEIEMMEEDPTPYEEYLFNLRDRTRLRGISLGPKRKSDSNFSYLTRRRDRLRMTGVSKEGDFVAWVSPTMTANNAPSPYVTSASHEYGTQYAWEAFDGIADNSWSAGLVAPAGEWIKLSSETKYIRITGMTLKNVATYGFKDFKLQGSNNGTNWTDIYVGSAANSTDVQSFSMPNNAYFKFHRVLCVTGWAGGLGAYEIGFTGYELL